MLCDWVLAPTRPQGWGAVEGGGCCTPTVGQPLGSVWTGSLSAPARLLTVLIRGEEDFFLNGILWLYIGGGLAVIIGVFFALRQRFAEISRGEEEEAKKY